MSNQTCFKPARWARMDSMQRACAKAYKDEEKLKRVIAWRARLHEAGITYANLAGHLGISRPRVSEWVNFRREPRPLTVEKIENILKSLDA